MPCTKTHLKSGSKKCAKSAFFAVDLTCTKSIDFGKQRKARAEIAKGIGIVKVAKAVGVGTVARLKKQMIEAREAA